MGQATDVAAAILQRPISRAEEDARREAARTVRAPQATTSGEIVDRPAPEAAPQPVIRAAQETWD